MSRSGSTVHFFAIVFYKTKKELDKYCSREGISHQGMVAEVEHLEINNIKQLKDPSKIVDNIVSNLNASIPIYLLY